MMKSSKKNNPFVLPIKKRFMSNAVAAAWQDLQHDDYEDGVVVPTVDKIEQQPLLPPSESAAATTTNTSPAAITTTTTTSSKKKKKKYRKPECSHPGCPNRVMNRGVCARHGARVRTCSVLNCTKYAQKGGVCIRHGAVKEYKRCVVGGCKSRPVGRGGVCARHVGCSGVGGKFI